MNDQDVSRMGAGRELDALIAEKVFAAHFLTEDRSPEHMVFRTDGGENYTSAPYYSSDIAAAWLVVEKMRQHAEPKFRNLTLTAYCYNRTYATFDLADAMGGYNPATWAEANGENATPLAICRAALLALGVSPRGTPLPDGTPK